MSLKLNLIVACSENNGIGKNGKLPWSLREEMKYFAKMTKLTQNQNKKNAVVMGRKTWESIPKKFRPLAGRLNILISTQAYKSPDAFTGCIAVQSFEEAIKTAETCKEELETIWVIGGSSVYNAALNSETVNRIYLTKIYKDFECDTFLPDISMTDYNEIKDVNVPDNTQEENGIEFKYHVYEKKI